MSEQPIERSWPKCPMAGYLPAYWQKETECNQVLRGLLAVYDEFWQTLAVRLDWGKIWQDEKRKRSLVAEIVDYIGFSAASEIIREDYTYTADPAEILLHLPSALGERGNAQSVFDWINLLWKNILYEVRMVNLPTPGPRLPAVLGRARLGSAIHKDGEAIVIFLRSREDFTNVYHRAPHRRVRELLRQEMPAWLRWKCCISYVRDEFILGTDFLSKF